MLDIINRIKKIQLQSDIINCCSDEIKFPRFEKKVQCSSTKHSSFISKDECITIIQKAKMDMNDELLQLGMKQKDLDFHCQVNPVKSLHEEIIDKELDDYTDDEFDSENVAGNNVEYDVEIEEELQENIRLLHGITGELSLKDYSGAGFDIDEKDPLTVVEDNAGNAKVVRKSAVCWYLQQNKCKLSSDRLQRVQENDIEKSRQKFHGKS